MIQTTEILLIVVLILAILNCISVERFSVEVDTIDTPSKTPNCEGMFSIFNKNCRYPRPNYTTLGGLQSTSFDADNKKLAVYCIGKAPANQKKPLLKLDMAYDTLNETEISNAIAKHCWRRECPDCPDCPECPVMEEVEEEEVELEEEE